MRRLVPVVAGLLLLAGCTSPEDVELGDGIVPTVEDGDDGPTPVPGSGDAPASPSPAAVAGSGASPAPGSCVDVPPADDGVYTVADAGTVTVTAADGALTLGPVQPFAGWAYTVTAEEQTEVSVELTKDTDRIELEVEVEDGEPVAQVCADG